MLDLIASQAGNAVTPTTFINNASFSEAERPPS